MNVMGRCILSGTRGFAKVVSLNRPRKLNAIDGPMVIELGNELKRLSEESLGGSGASTVVVLRGEGRAFSAGGDVEMVRRKKEAG
jgi:enoyl-CoA hydratase/carnithine racemase